jgi:UDP-glucose 4-epimerase
MIGESGFLGSHVADQLTDRGYQVRVFDRAASKWLRPEQQMIIGDLLDFEAVQQAVSGAEVVYNLQRSRT